MNVSPVLVAKIVKALAPVLLEVGLSSTDAMITLGPVMAIVKDAKSKFRELHGTDPKLSELLSFIHTAVLQYESQTIIKKNS
jgi:hypothetical protein